jgi:hypothetical protein
MSFKKNFLCLRVKKNRKRDETMIVDIDESINLYITRNWLPTEKLKKLFGLFASRGIEVRYFGKHREPLMPTHVLRHNVLFELKEIRRGRDKKTIPRPIAMEIFVC